MKQQKSLKVNAILNITKTLMGLVFPLITFPYASRILMPEGLGKVNFALSIISYFAIISSLGIENYGIREAAKLRDDKIQLSKFSKEIFMINMISTIVAYALLAVAIIFIPKFLEYRRLLIVSSATILFTTLGMNWLYSAVEDYLYITIRSIIFQVISLILLFLLVHSKDDYVKYAAISVVSNVGSNILNFVHSRKYISFKIDKPLKFKKHLKPIMVLFAMAVAVKIYTVLDTTMIGFLKNDYEVGIYTAATKINKIVLSLVVSIGTVLLPRLSYYSSMEDKTEFYKLAYKGFDILLLIALPSAVGLSLLSTSIVHLLSGNGYEAAILPMRIMNPIIVVIGLSNFIGIQMFMPLNKEKWTLYSVLVGAVVNFFINLFLIPIYGSVGASIATLCAETTVTLTQLILLRRFLKINKIAKSLIKYFLNSVVMGVFIYACVRFISVEWVELVIGVIVGVVVYILILVIEKNELIYEVLTSIKNKIKKGVV